MHESSYSPPLPLNLSISERAQSFFFKDLNGWLLALTGQGPPTAGHCIFLLALIGTDGSLYILSSHIFCTITVLLSALAFIVSTFWKHIFLTTPLIFPIFFPSHLLYIVLIQRYKTF